MLKISTRQSPLDLRSPSVVRLCRGMGTQWLRVLTLVISDVTLLGFAWFIAEKFGTPWATFWNLKENPIALLLVLGICLGFLVSGGFYKAGNIRRDYLGLARSLTMAASVLLLVAYIYQPSETISRSHFLIFWLLSIIFICIGRYVINRVTNQLRLNGIIRYSAFLICDPDQVDASVSRIEQENRYNLVGVMDATALDRANRESTFAKIRSLGTVEAFVSWDAIKNRQHLCWHFRTAGIALHILPLEFEPLLAESRFHVIRGFPTLTFTPPMLTGVDFLVKQAFDFCVALLFILLMSPVYCAIALLIKFDAPGPIFYRQTRIGLHGEPFQVWKFRTMVTNADALQKELEAQNETCDGVLFKMKNDPRVTRIGKFLRQYSLDELPQLFNVLAGEMSLVGPRPLPLRDVEKFAERHFIRQEVLPGITGLWQVSGRSNIDDFEQVIYLDLSYIEHWSLWLDLSILLRTVKVVLQKSGAY
ncbi:sugar transferase [Leptolyngbya sp. NIES-3755]|nr:sugar transferase [Leptolyngbya sp. NIES-3755]